MTMVPFKDGMNLNESSYFQWLQLIESNPEDGDLLSNKTMKMLIMLSFMTIA